MDYSSGYTASYYASFIDPVTFDDDIRVSNNRIEIVSGNINHNNDSLKQSASIVLRDNFNDLTDQWIRIYMVASQSGDRERIPLFTGIASSPNTVFNLGVPDQSLNCYSVLKVAEDVTLPRGWYANAGENIGDIITDLLSVISAPVIISDGIPNLEKAVIAESNESNLSLVEYILMSINWRIQIDGNGYIYVSPEAEQPTIEFSPYEFDVIQADSFSVERDWFDCPNVLQVTSGNYMAIARDDDPESDLSTVARGREIWATEDSVALNDDESITTYSKNRLAELQTRSERASYTRRFIPGVNQDDIVRVNYPDLQGDFYVESQTINLSAGGTTSESVFRVL